MSWISFAIGLIFYAIGGGIVGYLTSKIYNDNKRFDRYFWYGIIAIVCFCIGGGLW